MCTKNDGCTHPEKLKGKPGKCSPEQIKECHGDAKTHPCEPAKPKPEQRGCCGSSRSGCCQ
jgi:hypothetical protein